jgi:hypothetical protein
MKVKKEEKRKNKGGGALQERSRFLDLKIGVKGEQDVDFSEGCN